MTLVDIGNTYTHFALCRNKVMVRTFKVSTQRITLKNLKKLKLEEPIVICSVVPALNKIFPLLKKRVYFVGKDILVPLRCLYHPQEVGQDRLVVAFAARRLYKGARLIIDFGTAITLDFLSEDGAYLGGFILPGIGSSLRAYAQCALLPKKITLKKIKVLIPKNTQQSILGGIREGFLAMLNSLVQRYRRRLRLSKKEKVILTGGDVDFLKEGFTFPYIYEPLLIFKGLNILAEDLWKKEKF